MDLIRKLQEILKILKNDPDEDDISKCVRLINDIINQQRRNISKISPTAIK